MSTPEYRRLSIAYNNRELAGPYAIDELPRYPSMPKPSIEGQELFLNVYDPVTVRLVGVKHYVAMDTGSLGLQYILVWHRHRP